MSSESDSDSSLGDPAPESTLKGRLKSLASSIAVAFTLILSVTTITGWFSNHWLVQLFAELRIQQVIGCLLVVPSALFAGYRWFPLVAVGLALTHLLWIVPAYIGDSTQPDLDSYSATVMVANVLTQNSQYEQIEKQILLESPDVVAIIELGPELDKRLKALTAYPYRYSKPQTPGNFGVGIYSRFPLEDEQSITYNMVSDVPTLFVTVRVPKERTHDGSADYQFRLVATHPVPPIGSEGNRVRNQHLNELAKSVQQIQADPPDSPLVVVGDFNLTPWSPVMSEFLQMSGLRRSGNGYGIEPTWYAGPTLAMGLKIDHCLINQKFCCGDYRVGSDIGSDHRPVIVKLLPSKQ